MVSSKASLGQDEVVDDSEPERAELRRRERNVQKISHSGRLHRRGQFCEVQEIIEITDGEDSDNNDRLGPKIINLSDCSSGSQPKRLTHKVGSTQNPHSKSESSTSRIINALPLPRVPGIMNSSPPNLPLSIDHPPDGNVEDDETAPKLNLARFSYSVLLSKHAPGKPSISRENSATRTNNEPKLPPKKKLAHRFAADFSDIDLAKVMKCVSCNLHWTARKTVVQKMMHIQSCAKKNSFTDETIHILLRKEIEQAADTPETKGKGKERATELAAPKTFFEDIVAGAAPKKKKKRPGIGESVQSITVTREVILDRARMVLGLSDMPAGGNESYPVHTQSIAARSLPTKNSILPSTQAFAESALAQKLGQTSRSLFSTQVHSPNELSEGEDEMLPATQGFAPSKLGNLIRRPAQALVQEQHLLSPNLRPSILSYTDIPNRLMTPDLNNIPPPYSPPAISIKSAKGRSPYPAPKKMDSPARLLGASLMKTSLMFDNFGVDFNSTNDHSHLLERDNDDACLTLNPGFNNRPKHGEFTVNSPTSNVTSISSVLATPTAIKSSRTRKIPRTRAVSSSPSPGDNQDTPKRRSRSPKAVGKRKAHPDPKFDETWEKATKEKILQDKALHLRILRYEPIHFNVFLNLVSDTPSTSSGKFKLNLRSFLDKQAIHFYGAEPGGRGRGAR